MPSKTTKKATKSVVRPAKKAVASTKRQPAPKQETNQTTVIFLTYTFAVLCVAFALLAYVQYQ